MLAVELAAVLALGRLAVHGGLQPAVGVLLAHPDHVVWWTSSAVAIAGRSSQGRPRPGWP